MDDGLRLELFADTSRTTELLKGEKNALSQGQAGTPGHPAFQRRSDLQDPTLLLESDPLYQKTLDLWPESWPDFTGFRHRVLMDASLQPLDPKTLLLGAPFFRAEKS